MKIFYKKNNSYKRVLSPVKHWQYPYSHILSQVKHWHYPHSQINQRYSTNPYPLTRQVMKHTHPCKHPAVSCCCGSRSLSLLFPGCAHVPPPCKMYRSLRLICFDNHNCCHTKTDVAGLTCHLFHSRHSDPRPPSPSTKPIMPGAWQCSH